MISCFKKRYICFLHHADIETILKIKVLLKKKM